MKPAGPLESAALRHALAIAASALLLRVCAEIEAPWHALLFVALVPWLAALDATRGVGGALASGLGMCVAFVALVFSWFPDAIADFGGLPAAVGWIALLSASPLLEPQLLVFAGVRGLARRRFPGERWGLVAWLSISAWIACDAWFPKLFADGLGTGLHASPRMRQAADLAGLPGLTCIVLWTNELAWWALRGARHARLASCARRVALACALPAALLGYGELRLASLARAPSDPPVRVALIQADISHYDRRAARDGTWAVTRRIVDDHFALSRRALSQHAVDWLVWPETVYPLSFGAPRSADGAAFDRELAGFVARARVPLLFGSYDADGESEFNAAFFLGLDGAPPDADHDGPAGLVYDVYRKVRLFPFTERLPAWLDTAWVRRALPWAGAWRAGGGPARVDLALADGRRLPVAPLICYDALDPELTAAGARAGARLIATLSNDSWFAHGLGPKLHLVQAAFRSIETRLPQLRSTNTGISALIDPSGEITAATGIHERDHLVGALTPRAAAAVWAPAGAQGLAVALLASSTLVAGATRRR